jgi:hypothetical protein
MNAECAGYNCILRMDEGDADSAYEFAVLAASYAHSAAEREHLRDAPAVTIFRNQQLALQRQASTLRCDCGGKLKRKTVARELVGVECVRCGRHFEVFAQEVAHETTTKEEEA